MNAQFFTRAGRPMKTEVHEMIVHRHASPTAYWTRLNFLLDSLFQDSFFRPTIADETIGRDDEGDWIRIPLPGYRPDEVKITVEGRRLTIVARNDGGEDDWGERRTVSRVLTLPEGTVATGITASLKYGVLTLRLPRRNEDKPVQIAVSGEEEAPKLGSGNRPEQEQERATA